MNSLQCRRPALAVVVILLGCCPWSFGQSGGPSPQPLGLVEALQSTLANQPALHIGEQQVVASRGARQQASGAFDTILAGTLSQNRINNPLTLFNQEQAALLGIITNNQVSNVTYLDIGATKEYRNGVTISPSLLATRSTDNIYDIGGVNLTTLSFQVTVPLLRGRGRDVVAATETAAGIEVQASFAGSQPNHQQPVDGYGHQLLECAGGGEEPGSGAALRRPRQGLRGKRSDADFRRAGAPGGDQSSERQPGYALGRANCRGTEPDCGAPTTGPGNGLEH